MDSKRRVVAAREVEGWFVRRGVPNRLRGRRLFQLPDRVGWPESAVFVLVPPLIPVLFGGDTILESFGLVATNLVILALTYAVVAFGLIPMTRWAIGQMLRQFGNLLNLMVRALPLLLVLSTFLFLNAELWQVAADFTGGLVAVREETIIQWTQLTPGELESDVLWSSSSGPNRVIVTRTLIRVAGFLAAFSGLQFTVSALTDEAWRREFVTDVIGEVREEVAVRALCRRGIVGPVGVGTAG